MYQQRNDQLAAALVSAIIDSQRLRAVLAEMYAFEQAHDVAPFYTFPINHDDILRLGKCRLIVRHRDGRIKLSSWGRRFVCDHL